MSGGRPSEVFVSHADADAPLASAVARTLSGHGVGVWYSRRSLRGGDAWQDEIGAALGRCDWFVVLLTPRSCVSEWVRREVKAALRQQQFNGRLVPYLAETCDVASLSWTLPDIQWIDGRDDFVEGVRGLLGVWGIGLDPRRVHLPHAPGSEMDHG